MTLRWPWHRSALIPAWGFNYIHYKVFDEITYLFPNFKGCTVEVWEWKRHFIPHLTEQWLHVHAGIKVALVAFDIVINSFGPIGIIRRHISESIFAQVTACCMTVPSCHLNHWTCVACSSAISCGIHLKAISQCVPDLIFCGVNIKCTFKTTPTSPWTHMVGALQTKIWSLFSLMKTYETLIEFVLHILLVKVLSIKLSHQLLTPNKGDPANILFNECVIITSKRRFDVTIK